MSAASDLRARALAAARTGDVTGARALFDAAVTEAPGDAALLNSAASFHVRHGSAARALELYDQALAADPRHAEAALNKGIVLSKLGRPADAATWLLAHERELEREPRYWSARAAAELASGDRAAAAASYDATLRRDPGHARALHGRARIALERGEEDMVDRYRRATVAKPDDAQAWLGLAMAFDHAGRSGEALALADRLVGQAPGWIEALELLATLRWAAGETRTFCDHYSSAVARTPGDPGLYQSWSRMLAGVDDAAGATAVVADARTQFPKAAELALAHAAHLGNGGFEDEVEAILAALVLDTVDRRLHEARHRLRRREFDRAEALLAGIVAEHPDHVSAWALRDLAWRMMGDTRHAWLHGRDGLVRSMPLDLTTEEHERVVAVLDQLHDAAAMPVGQSVRHGTQTRGGLFDRLEPELAPLRRAIDAAVDAYRTGLPPCDPEHPLLRYRGQPWTLSGSWSIRLFGGGRHVEHIHSNGLASSAAYLVVPEGEDAGVLDLGRSPPNLRLDLPPIASIRPQPLHCALFPSTLFHGTRPFAAGKRMTVAFDVQTG